MLDDKETRRESIPTTLGILGGSGLYDLPELSIGFQI
jgi:hypothetical protein